MQFVKTPVYNVSPIFMQYILKTITPPESLACFILFYLAQSSHKLVVTVQKQEMSNLAPYKDNTTVIKVIEKIADQGIIFLLNKSNKSITYRLNRIFLPYTWKIDISQLDYSDLHKIDKILEKEFIIPISSNSTPKIDTKKFEELKKELLTFRTYLLNGTSKQLHLSLESILVKRKSLRQKITKFEEHTLSTNELLSIYDTIKRRIKDIKKQQSKEVSIEKLAKKLTKKELTSLEDLVVTFYDCASKYMGGTRRYTQNMGLDTYSLKLLMGKLKTTDFKEVLEYFYWSIVNRGAIAISELNNHVSSYTKNSILNEFNTKYQQEYRAYFEGDNSELPKVISAQFIFWHFIQKYYERHDFEYDYKQNFANDFANIKNVINKLDNDHHQTILFINHVMQTQPAGKVIKAGLLPHILPTFKGEQNNLHKTDDFRQNLNEDVQVEIKILERYLEAIEEHPLDKEDTNEFIRLHHKVGRFLSPEQQGHLAKVMHMLNVVNSQQEIENAV